MSTVRWRPEFNALTTPHSYFIRFMPHDVVGYDAIVEEVAQENPVWSKEQLRMMMIAVHAKIAQFLANGRKVTLENAFSFTLSMNGRLESPEEQVPDGVDRVQVRISASTAFVESVRRNVRLEKMPLSTKLPVIASAEDTVLGLHDVLWANGVLMLTGSRLAFDPDQAEIGCVIEGTRNGRAKQERFGMITNSAVIIVPTIPAQTNPWNNEYLVSLSTKYSENGTIRTGTTQRRLRTPITVSGIAHTESIDVGMLTGNATEPYVTLISCGLEQDENIRVQVVVDSLSGHLRFRLLDMHEDGNAGDEVVASANGQINLAGFSGSAVSGISIVINKYQQLVRMIKSTYAGRLVDVLFLRMEQG